MKATLEFDLDLPDDEHRMRQCMKARDALLVISDMSEEIRAKIKYSDNDVEIKYAQYWQAVLYGLMDKREIYPEDYQ